MRRKVPPAKPGRRPERPSFPKNQKEEDSMKKKNPLHAYALSLFPAIAVGIFGLFTQAAAQIDYARETAQHALPDYDISYDAPTVEQILSACNRIRDYCLRSTSFQIVDRKTGRVLTDFSAPNENAAVDERLGPFNAWAYTNGVTLSAFDYLSETTGDASYREYNIRFYDFVFDHLPYFRKNAALYGPRASGWRSIIYMGALDDCGSIGAALIKTCRFHPDARYRAMIDTVADYITRRQFRLKDGSLARHRPQPESQWADDLYMSVPFLANMGKYTGEAKYTDDAVRQVLRFADRLFVKEKGLFDHGWNSNSADYDPRFYWGRGNGWVLMAMAELLPLLPPEHKGREPILQLYRSMVRSLAEMQDGSGFWHNMLDKTDTKLETSCTAMFVYAIAKGINEGWVSHVYGPVAQAGWNALDSRILHSGQVDGVCEGTTYAHDNVYYYHRGQGAFSTHGYGPVLYAGAEMMKLLKNDKLEIIKARPGSVNSTHFYLLKSQSKEAEIFRGN
jgi:unsaturated rhamnogalacturonyl hydrolase